MSPAAQSIANDINTFIRNVPLSAFADLNMNRILLNMLQLADVTGGGGGGGSLYSGLCIPIASSNFTGATNCNMSFLAGQPVQVYWEEGKHWLDKVAGEVVDLPGGGFQVGIPDFNSANDNYHFYVFPSTS